MQRVQTPRSQRRQNASCDQCRRSKRRCLLDNLKDRETGAVCNNCKNLKFPCTFNFAESRSGRGSKKQQRRNLTSSRQSLSSDGAGPLDRGPNGFTEVSSNDFHAGLGANDGLLDSWLDLDVDLFTDDRLKSLPNSIDLSNAAPFPQAPTGSPLDAQRDAEALPMQTRPATVPTPPRPRISHIVGSSLSSPIRLLNSSMNAAILDGHLARIYDTITRGSASIFLDFNCNMYTGRCRYRFEDIDSHNLHRPTTVEPSTLRKDPLTNLSTQIPLPAISSSPFGQAFRLPPGAENPGTSRILARQEDGHKMTVLGAVRFLDHFSDLYGNKLTLDARVQSDEVLKEVLRVFSFQWLPAPGFSSDLTPFTNDNIPAEPVDRRNSTLDSSPSAFLDTWFRARSLIYDTQSVQSFRVVYATLLFDTITIPHEISDDSNEYVLAHEFLDHGLAKLSFLDALVKKYCANLGPLSEYGALMESSLSIVCWFGYLRESVAALTTSRQCRIKDVRSNTKGPSINELSLDSVTSQSFGSHTDSKFPNICRRAIAEAFLVWRRIIRIKNANKKGLDGVTSPVSIPLGAITSTMKDIGDFEESFRPFMNQCTDQFANLSTGSRKFSVFLMVFWDLGVLILAQHLKSVLNETDQSQEHLISSIRTYQWLAAVSVAQTVECVLALPCEEAFKPESGLGSEVPIIACHVTPILVVTALQKAVEQIIDLQFSSEEGLVPDGVWHHHIGSLLKGLVSLEVTIGGSRTASSALQSLLRNYGDIISECWSD